MEMRYRFFLAHRTEAFSLVEIIIYTGALVLMMVFVVGFFIRFLNSYAAAKTRRALEDNLTSAMDSIVREIRQARSIYYPTSCFSPLQGGASPSCNALLGQVSLETTRSLPLYGTESASTETQSFVDIYVASDGTFLRRRENAAVPLRLISEEMQVTRLEFRDRSTAKTQAVQVELEMKNKSGPEQRRSIQTTAILREYNP